MKKRVLQGMETKKRLIECARKLFQEKGYNAVTVEDIIKAAHSSKGGFYTHFKSKEELMFNMVHFIDQRYNEFSKTGGNAENSVNKIALFIQYVFNTMEEEIGLEFMSAIYASQIKDSTTERVLIASERKYYHVLKTILEEGQAKNEIKLELSVEETITIFTSCIRGVIYDWCLHKGEFNLAGYGGKVMDMLLKQIKN